MIPSTGSGPSTGPSTGSGSGVLDFSPAAAPAPAVRRILRHARTEALLLVRNGEQLVLALVIPLAVLVAGRFFAPQVGPFALLAPSVLALATWSTCFTAVAISTGFERRYGVLERLAATPLGRGGLLAGKALAVLMVLIGQLVLLGVAAAVLGWRPDPTPGSAALAGLAVLLGGAGFVALALLLAGRLRAEATLGLANVIYVLLLAGGGLVVPVDRYPAAVRPLVAVLPTGALGEALRAGSNGTTPGWPLIVLLVWLAVAGLITRKVFRWLS